MARISEKLYKGMQRIDLLHLFFAVVLTLTTLAYTLMNWLGMRIAAEHEELIALGRRVTPLKHSGDEYRVLLSLSIVTTLLAMVALILLWRARPSFSWPAVATLAAGGFTHVMGQGLLDNDLLILIVWPALILSASGYWYYEDSALRKAGHAGPVAPN